ncbi:TolC family protein [Bacteroides sp. 519]|uniref:TolC family protein n=1 Tax=Bacteroides sp. 519 TaxID=2302937 RepID=UPI0013CF9751|nr:TolC family protein [Bacteroides sp. 519]NDV60492.1 TolC family protein [Bacteroides sp. 519]
MKKISKKSVLALLVVFSLSLNNTMAQETKTTLNLSLDQALQIALSENPTIIVAGQEIEKKQYAKKGVVAQLFPQISASAGYTRTIKKQVMYMGGGSGGGMASMIMEPLAKIINPLYEELGLTPDWGSGEETEASSGDGGFEVGLANNWSGGFNLSLPIFAPTLYKSISLSGLDVELAVEQSRASKQDLKNQVTKAYYQLLLAQDSYEVLQQSYKQAEDNYNIVNNSFQQGLVSEYDKIRAEVQVRNLNPSLLQAKNAVQLTKLQLKVLIGMDSDTDLNIVGRLSDYEDNMYVDYMKIDTTLVLNNSSLKQLDIQKEMLLKTYQMNKAEYLPTVSASAMLQWIAMNEDFKFKDYKWSPYSTVGVTVSIPIFTGGARSHKIKQTKIQMQQVDWNRINLQRSLNMQAESYMNNMQVSVEQLASNKENVNQALKGRTIAQKRYEVGKGTILELNDSELALTQSKLTYTQAIYDFLVAKSDLDLVLGKDGEGN